VALDAQARALRERLALTRDKARALVALEHEWRGLERLPELAALEQAVRAELDALDTRDVAALRAVIAQGAVEVAGLQAALREIDRRSGAWEQQAHALEYDDIPALEQALEQIDRNLEAFLAAETGERAAEVRAESEQECRRRCERAPVDEVIARATRYENDYQALNCATAIACA
jgi:ketosteroid isomerase-like protein